MSLDWLLTSPHEPVQLSRQAAVEASLAEGRVLCQVLNCRDHKSGDLVALKVIRNQKRFHKQAQVEVEI